MIVFLIDKVTPRWEYTFDFIFGTRGIEYLLTPVEPELLETDYIYKISSSEGRLLRNDQVESEIDSEDLLSRLFFVLTRMEEYDSINLDRHQRFSAKQSWQYKNSLLDQCICDRWALEFIEKLNSESNIAFSIKGKEVEIIPTFDIDNAFAYKNKTGRRAFLSRLKSAVKLDFAKLWGTYQVVFSIKKDPYDGYEKIQEVANHFPVRLFWQVGDYGGKDYNISLKKKEIKELVQNLAEKMQVGVHPSYKSNADIASLDSEIKSLQQTIGIPLKASRQHFLKLSIPETYRNLLERGIEEDYTMGFADEVGFRNGTAKAFPWFDLKKNEVTGLTIYPFAYMDGTLNEYLKLSPDQAKKKISDLYKEVEQFGGQFSFIWHNETITDYKIWEGWSSVLDFTLTLKNTKS